MHRVLYAIAGLAFLAPHIAGAQRFPTQRDPTSWLGIGVGAFNAGEIADGKSGAEWDFGSRTSPQYRASIEKVYRGQFSIGLDGSFVRAPILYRPFAAQLPEATCLTTCAAKMDVYSLYAKFHAGGGQGLHQVVDAGLGVVSYQNFKRESDGERLEPLKADRDFAFIFGYGFGYTLNQRAQVNLVQEYGFNFHGSADTPSGSSNTLRYSNTRLTFRMGMGGQAPVRRRR